MWTSGEFLLYTWLFCATVLVVCYKRDLDTKLADKFMARHDLVDTFNLVSTLLEINFNFAVYSKVG